MMSRRLRFPKITQWIVSPEEGIHTEPGCLAASNQGKLVISTVLKRWSQKCGCSKNSQGYRKCCTWVPSPRPNNSARIWHQQCWRPNEREPMNFIFIVICDKAERSMTERKGIWIQLVSSAKSSFSSSFCSHAVLPEWVTCPSTCSYNNRELLHLLCFT